MNIFDSTLELKKLRPNNNTQLFGKRGHCEISGFSPLPILKAHGLAQTHKDYLNQTKIAGKVNGIYAKGNEISTVRRSFNSDISEVEKIIDKKLHVCDIDTHDTKEYWNFLHENFQYCDVCSYTTCNSIEEYFALKGPHYDAIIEVVGIDNFKDKKILEIGPGYGYLPKVLADNNINCEYYCADIVQRFEHKNFINVSGYSISDFVSDKFDIIVMYDVLQHLGQKISDTYVKDISKLLKDEGKFIVSPPMYNLDHLGTFFGQVYNTSGFTAYMDFLTHEDLFPNTKQLIVNKTIIGGITICKKFKTFS